MKLKYIGGPAHGMVRDLRDGEKAIHVIEQLPVPSLSSDPVVSPQLLPSVKTYCYTRRILRERTEAGDIKELQYLAPHWLSDLDSLRPLLT